ncbi:SusC/RagA family TonB-linked outer membrane protein [Chitinophaga sp. SYP-B3965]|uniref:SusC/RagA family TonB-linked outer membrane protein n=1 Tax=Chitinophaga sp. SYP-B3965 TaxID=2663120 RepID=UPI00129968A4|nr:SusC/RagA family TonB-linked outer membrane protein [Chitinophaga sp. SYP-B3965]MRG43813.1 SusC/RagA family TonB-linked outer membrane protein [Chitinophaga sp. SYP-B3965]
MQLCSGNKELNARIIHRLGLFVFALCCLLSLQQVSAQDAKNTTVSLQVNDRTLKEVFLEIEKQTGFTIEFRHDVLDQNKHISIIATKESVSKVLERLLAGTGTTFLQKNKSILIIKGSPAAPKAARPVSGNVRDNNGEILIGVSVSANTVHTTTNENGDYFINVPEGVDAITFNYVGIKPYSEKTEGRSVINVQLARQNVELGQVVVTALGIKREARALSYSIQGVNVEAMNETKSTNLINSLSGKVAGVQVIPAGFNTGSSRIIIRGNNSLTGNNQPLFVVDGMPIDNEPGEDGSIDYGSSANDINPDDIENIQILKGPNASALYGSRGSNGVVLITTKKGSAKFKVAFNSSMMFQKLTEFPEYQNAYGVGTSFAIDPTNRIPRSTVNYRSWGSPMLGQPYVALDGKVKPYLPHPDNIKDFYSTAGLFTNSLAVEGGNASNVYRIAYTNYSGTSVVKGFNDMGRHSVDFRLLNTFSKWLTLDSKLNYVRDIVDNRQYSNSNGRNPTNLYTHMARSTDLAELLPYKDPLTGMEIGTHRNFSNPYWVINENPNKDIKDRLIASFNAEAKITPWLKFNGRFGTDLYWWDGFEFNNIGSVVASNPNGFMRTFNTKQQNLNLEGIFSFSKNIKDFSIQANLGASKYTSSMERREQRINSLLQPGLINLSNAKEYPTVSQTIRRKEINSVFGSVSLGYRNYAFIDLTGRNDKSSTLPKGNNSYFYPSLGGSLIISDLLHMNSNFLNFLKVRGSIAMVGGDSNAPYLLEQTYSFNGFLNDATLASLSTTMNNPDLKPEKTNSYEFGLNARLLKNRISLDATYYNAATTNQIITAQLPASSGYQQRIYNAGKIRNWGYEASATAKLIAKKNFQWETSLNFSKNNSMVVELIDGVDRFQMNNNSSYLYVYAQVGKPYAYLRGLGVARDAKGHMLIEDGGSLLVKDNDMAFGTASPDWLGGINNTFRLGRLDFSFLFDVKMGGVIYSGSFSRMLTNGVSAETLYGRDDFYLHSVILGENGSELSGGAQWDAYFADGTKNTKYVTPQNYEYARPNYAEFVIYDASFIKLREVTLGYNFSEKPLRRTPIKTARISLAGRNLAILYRKTPKGLDPEAASTAGNGQGIENGALPPNAIYGFNIKLTL